MCVNLRTRQNQWELQERLSRGVVWNRKGGITIDSVLRDKTAECDRDFQGEVLVDLISHALMKRTGT